MVIIGFAINFVFEMYMNECKVCKERKLKDAIDCSNVSKQSVGDCMDELMMD